MIHNDFEVVLNEIIRLNNCFSQLSHASNLIGKWIDDGKTKAQAEALPKILDRYYDYLVGNLELSGFNEAVVYERVSLLNTYYDFFYSNHYDNLFSSQGKLRPTILEEFMFLLFKDYVSYLKDLVGDSEGVLDCGSAKAYTNLYFSSKGLKDFIQSPVVCINEKNQDFAIFRVFRLGTNKSHKDIRIPIVAIENKTYIDKTMLDGIISTADRIKTGNPYSMFIAVAENYDVDLSVDPAYSRIDQIYVLRKSKRKERWASIDSQVVWRMFCDVKEHIERPWSNVEDKLRNEGIII